MTKSKQYLAWQLARNALAEHLKEHPTIVTNPASGESVRAVLCKGWEAAREAIEQYLTD